MKEEESYQQFATSIAAEIRQFQASMEAYLPDLEQAVNSIITSRSTNAHEIERLLDTLLNLQYAGIGEALFLRLLEYYKTLDSEAAADYWEFFDEIGRE